MSRLPPARGHHKTEAGSYSTSAAGTTADAKAAASGRRLEASGFLARLEAVATTLPLTALPERDPHPDDEWSGPMVGDVPVGPRVELLLRDWSRGVQTDGEGLAVLFNVGRWVLLSSLWGWPSGVRGGVDWGEEVSEEAAAHLGSQVGDHILARYAALVTRPLDGPPPAPAE